MHSPVNGRKLCSKKRLGEKDMSSLNGIPSFSEGIERGTLFGQLFNEQLQEVHHRYVSILPLCREQEVIQL